MPDHSRSGHRPARRDSKGGRGSPARGAGPDPARRVSYEVLRAVRERDAYANLLLPSMLRERKLTGRDAALATELSYGTLRHQGSYDAILDTCVDRSLSSVDPEVLVLLRLGAHQLLNTKIPPHAAVSATIALARRVIGTRRSRFANAVLRRVAARDLAEWLEIVAPDRDADVVGHLAVTHSHPRWAVEALAQALGEDPAGGLAETGRLLVAHNERPQVSVAAKPGRASVEDLVDSGAVRARYSPYGAYLPEGDPASLREVKQQRAVVQDEASQLVALALARVGIDGADSHWLDACAGPGGKAALLAGLAGQREARLLAAEAQQSRARLVAGAVRRSVRDAGRTVVADSTRPPWREGSFDRVLVDAPCTGLGALRRRPEARWRRDADSVAELVPLQRSLLERAIEATRPGGVVGYVTCSPHLAETRGVVTEVLAGRGDVTVLRAADYLDAVPDIAVGDYVQFWPHRHGTDAMFLALLRRRAD
ncbi:RsmB/NOP family class I SAM-dependent RNA methyltransferase [Halostreptopolyspora alba]|uniref:rRNA cytosine-C5-methyltransferase n=1 Tax=Halostreptopolyspora alba TaxID=2487137 RepID=A0A3N0EEX8_9ACTN|nr:rRNA cytosine-C5-methyltransferase [Nocardiopsaceae bacterium YIM 96095]